jgi:glycine hydroxymethyltransferase
LNGAEATDLLAEVGITVNKNSVPFDPLPPTKTSGIRIGTPALATRGFGEPQFREVADIIAKTLIDHQRDLATLRSRVAKLCQDFPLYPHLG